MPPQMAYGTPASSRRLPIRNRASWTGSVFMAKLATCRMAASPPWRRVSARSAKTLPLLRWKGQIATRFHSTTPPVRFPVGARSSSETDQGSKEAFHSVKWVANGNESEAIVDADVAVLDDHPVAGAKGIALIHPPDAILDAVALVDEIGWSLD